MATAASVAFAPLPVAKSFARKTSGTKVNRVAVVKPVAKLSLSKATPAASVASVAVTAMSMIPAEHAQAAQEFADLALATNKTGSIATALFVFLPVTFLVGLFVKSDSEGNVSGGFSQSYYDASKKRKDGGGKKTNDSAKFKGKGLGMYSED
mmetsp:Transcript_28838/g.35049  ORF Transcript_28838/g.35049 Transcript_28838/m.35049 type:complete len:152 (-) Transcript_28838:131-586(-)|eukprot:CAMPEP_0197851656 /NCGR_PEP_ID=MMETSP1438-20131217/18540_1 /TAXON_ID=1461541 /ORGANISM="Pterosperma sp., Strain CCMP1384" /LENGTH=151 /DNA_ID=CAMNT_0043465341 /DNA_START=77 /DNA_END=532 /DNA_ORIENTATION=+